MPGSRGDAGCHDAGEEILEQRKLDLALQLTEQYKGLNVALVFGAIA